MPQISKEDLSFLTVFLTNVEIHEQCESLNLPELGHQPEDCMNAIYARWRRWKMSEILVRLEEELIKED